jgi:uncharacterized protein YdhG (YjbR/CyaY superfamily)
MKKHPEFSKSRQNPNARQGRKAKSDKLSTIDAYLATLGGEKRAALQKLRAAIKAAAPKAEECISYRLPAFRLGGRMLVWFGAAANHCSFYPGSSAVEAHRHELKAYDTSKGTIRFQADHPLPATLVRRLVRARIASSGRLRGSASLGRAERTA